MRKPLFQLYLPFFAVILGQALLITLAPSVSRDQGANVAAGPAAGGQTIDPVTGEVIDPATGQPVDGAGGVDAGGTAGGTGGGGGGGATAGGAGGGGGAAGSGGGVAAGDVGHCRNGRQHAVVPQAPPCVPKFAGNNGGATYNGVTGDKIKVVAFFSEPNEQVDAALAPSGLTMTRAERDNFVKAATAFLNKRYEFYGRKLEVEVVEGDCPTTPPDVPACKQAAREVIAKKPFAVVWDTGLYSEVFNEWSRAGIVTLGGSYFAREFFTSFRPLRYDANMDGTQAAELIAEYYCKKMAGKMATHSGRVIHSSIGARGQVRRKLGISVPSDPASVAAARVLAAKVKECDGQDVPIVQYVSDINRAQEQGRASTASYIQAKVTTVTCMCDALAPIFGGNAFTQQQYFPENLSSGIRSADDDRVVRLYDSQQRQHGFGLGQLPVGQPPAQSDASAIWRDAGNSGNACNACGGLARQFLTLGTLIQQAGPQLNPANIERGVVSAKYRRGAWEELRNPFTQLFAFGPNDYTAVSNVRLTYWCETCNSPIDGRPGASVALEGGRRWELGQIPRSDLSEIPVAPN